MIWLTSTSPLLTSFWQESERVLDGRCGADIDSSQVSTTHGSIMGWGRVAEIHSPIEETTVVRGGKEVVV
jgi:hypothetical protein